MSSTSNQQSEIPATMRAWTFSKSGNWREVLTLKDDLPTPSLPTGDQILVKIAYVSLNPADKAILSVIPSFLVFKDSIAGLDLSGKVVARGPRAKPEFGVGEYVFGTPSASARAFGNGTLAEYVLLGSNSAKIRVVPNGVALREASGLGVVGFTAVETTDRAGVKGGERVLVNGASGGCGTVVVQALKGLGAKEVVAVCSEKNEELVKRLGADKVIDYTTHVPVHKYLEEEYKTNPFDVIIDVRGSQDLYTHSPAFLKETGPFINIGQYTYSIPRTLFHMLWNTYWPTILGGVPRKYISFSQNASAGQIDKLVTLVEERKLNVVVDKVFEMEEVLEAFDFLASRGARGKVIVKVGGDL